MIKLAQNDIEIADCFQVINQLRTELDEAAFVPLVRELMSGGYQLAYLRDEAQVVCVARFKISQNLFYGRHLYVEDLSTLESERSKDHGKQMMACFVIWRWLKVATLSISIPAFTVIGRISFT